MKALTKHPLFLTPALLAMAPTATVVQELKFAPADDTTLTKTFATDMEFNLDDLSIMVDGQDVSAMMGAFEMSMTSESEISVTDTYMGVADGRPTKLKRTFDALESNTSVDVATEFGGESQDIPASSPLEGATVIYIWNADEDKYDVAYEEEGGDEELLDGLIEDFDMRTFLPPGPVEVGDSWTVDGKALAELAMQGNSLHLMPEEMGEDELEMMEQFMNDEFMSTFEELYDGLLECTLKGMREEDGNQLADIEVKMELNASVDLVDTILEVIATVAESEGEEMPPLDLSAADLNADFEGEGTFVWNLTNNHMQSLESAGDFSVAFDISASVEEGGESQSFDASIEGSGTISTKASAE